MKAHCVSQQKMIVMRIITRFESNCYAHNNPHNMFVALIGFGIWFDEGPLPTTIGYTVACKIHNMIYFGRIEWWWDREV